MAGLLSNPSAGVALTPLPGREPRETGSLCTLRLVPLTSTFENISRGLQLLCTIVYLHVEISVTKVPVVRTLHRCFRCRTREWLGKATSTRLVTSHDV